MKGVFIHRTLGGIHCVVMPEGKVLLPTGKLSEEFEVGYSGQGPSELAYCILNYFAPMVAIHQWRSLVPIIAKIELFVGEQQFISEEDIMEVL